MRRPDPWRAEAVAAAALALGLVAATYPAWRVLLLPAAPTTEELLRVVCGLGGGGPGAWLRR